MRDERESKWWQIVGAYKCGNSSGEIARLLEMWHPEVLKVYRTWGNIEEWAKIPQDYFNKLVLSMGDRNGAVIRAKGGTPNIRFFLHSLAVWEREMALFRATALHGLQSEQYN